MTPWQERSVEERTLLNPAFVAVLLWHGADGYRSESGQGLPFPLAFLLVPVALHPGTRQRLPRSVSTSLAGWLEDNQYLRATFPGRARALTTAVREGVGVALETGLMSAGDDAVIQAVGRLVRRSDLLQTPDSQDALKRARFTGRWFARAGSTATIFALWGVRP